MILALLLLAGGAVVNVAVAWGIVLRVDAHRMLVSTQFGDEIDAYSNLYPQWASRPDFREVLWCRGARYEHLSGDEHDEQTESWRSSYMLIARVGWPRPALLSYDYWFETNFGVLAESSWFEKGIKLDREIEGGWGPIPGHWPPRHLPLYPLRQGFTINTLFYALLLWLLLFAPFAARRMLRRRRGLCEKCAYPIGVSQIGRAHV